MQSLDGGKVLMFTDRYYFRQYGNKIRESMIVMNNQDAEKADFTCSNVVVSESKDDQIGA